MLLGETSGDVGAQERAGGEEREGGSREATVDSVAVGDGAIPQSQVKIIALVIVIGSEKTTLITPL